MTDSNISINLTKSAENNPNQDAPWTIDTWKKVTYTLSALFAAAMIAMIVFLILWLLASQNESSSSSFPFAPNPTQSVQAPAITKEAPITKEPAKPKEQERELDSPDSVETPPATSYADFLENPEDVLEQFGSEQEDSYFDSPPVLVTPSRRSSNKTVDPLKDKQSSFELGKLLTQSVATQGVVRK